MKFYLSSFKFGSKKLQLKEMAPNDTILIIPNALDYRPNGDEQTKKSLSNKKLRLEELGFQADILDLKEFFGKQKKLEEIVKSTGAIFVLGGNVFVLRQAMWLSGLDEILTDQELSSDFLYSGYSAGGCVLAPSLRPYSVIGDATLTPYTGLDRVIWNGLGLVDFAFMPHYKSDHPESAAIDRGISYCEKHHIKYRKIHDGEVLIF